MNIFLTLNIVMCINSNTHNCCCCCVWMCINTIYKFVCVCVWMLLLLFLGLWFQFYTVLCLWFLFWYMCCRLFLCFNLPSEVWFWIWMCCVVSTESVCVCMNMLYVKPIVVVAAHDNKNTKSHVFKYKNSSSTQCWKLSYILGKTCIHVCILMFKTLYISVCVCVCECCCCCCCLYTTSIFFKNSWLWNKPAVVYMLIKTTKNKIKKTDSFCRCTWRYFSKNSWCCCLKTNETECVYEFIVCVYKSVCVWTICMLVWYTAATHIKTSKKKKKKQLTLLMLFKNDWNWMCVCIVLLHIQDLLTWFKHVIFVHFLCNILLCWDV